MTIVSELAELKSGHTNYNVTSFHSQLIINTCKGIMRRDTCIKLRNNQHKNVATERIENGQMVVFVLSKPMIFVLRLTVKTDHTKNYISQLKNEDLLH